MQYYEKVDKSKLENVDITNYAMAGYLSQKRQKSLDMALYGLSKNPRYAAWKDVYKRQAYINLIKSKIIWQSYQNVSTV